MMKSERKAYIVHQVNLHNKVLLTELTGQLGVSNDTIRRDLQELSDGGSIIKVHGGAVSHAFHNNHPAHKEVYAYQQKKIIAKKAINLIQNGMYILTGGGTTILELARALPEALQATFISGSLPALLEYTNHPKIEVIAIGDKIAKDSKITIGSEAIWKIRELKVDICFLGINAINISDGVSDSDWDIVQVKKAMIESSRKLVCLTIAEKINTRQPVQICSTNKVHTLITELPPEDERLKPYVNAGIQVI